MDGVLTFSLTEMLRLVKCVMITPLLTSRREIAPSPRRPQGALEFFSCTRHILHLPMQGWGFPHGSVGKESTGNAGDAGRSGFNSQVRKIPWRRAWQPTPVFSPGESHGQSSLMTPIGSDTTKVTEPHACNGMLMYASIPYPQGCLKFPQVWKYLPFSRQSLAHVCVQ